MWSIEQWAEWFISVTVHVEQAVGKRPAYNYWYQLANTFTTSTNLNGINQLYEYDPEVSWKVGIRDDVNNCRLRKVVVLTPSSYIHKSESFIWICIRNGVTQHSKTRNKNNCTTKRIIQLRPNVNLPRSKVKATENKWKTDQSHPRSSRSKPTANLQIEKSPNNCEYALTT